MELNRLLDKVLASGNCYSSLLELSEAYYWKIKYTYSWSIKLKKFFVGFLSVDFCEQLIRKVTLLHVGHSLTIDWKLLQFVTNRVW